MFFWISLIVLIVYYNNEWTTIGPGLLFCLFAMVAECISDIKNPLREIRDKMRRH